MSLITCHECGKEISDSADMCPNCGYSVSKSLKYKVIHKYEKEINGMSVNLMGIYIKCGYDQRKTAMYISEKTDVSMEKAEKIVFNFYTDFGNDKRYVDEYKKAVYIIDPNNRNFSQDKNISVSKVIFIALTIILLVCIISPNIRTGFINCGSSIRTELGVMLKMEDAIREKYDNAYVEITYLGLVFIPMEEISTNYEFTGDFYNNYPVFKEKETNKKIIGFDWAGNPIYDSSSSDQNKRPNTNNANTKEPWQ